MTALDTAPRRASHVAASYRVTFPRLLRSEWIKLSTLRSTWWSIGLTAVLTFGIALLMAAAFQNAPGFPAINAVVIPFQFTMLLAGILGAIAVTGEYATGMIRSTFAAQPRRGAVLAAKAVVVAAFLFIASLVIFAVAAVLVAPFFSGDDAIDWRIDGTWMPILTASASMAVFALIGLAFGFMIRSGAGAIAAAVGLRFVLPIVASIFAGVSSDWEWIGWVADHLPLAAAQYAIITEPGAPVEAAEAWGTLAAWVAATALGAWAVLRTRDA